MCWCRMRAWQLVRCGPPHTMPPSPCLPHHPPTQLRYPCSAHLLALHLALADFCCQRLLGALAAQVLPPLCRAALLGLGRVCSRVGGRGGPGGMRIQGKSTGSPLSLRRTSAQSRARLLQRRRAAPATAGGTSWEAPDSLAALARSSTTTPRPAPPCSHRCRTAARASR